MRQKYQCYSPLFKQQRQVGFKIHRDNLKNIRASPSNVRIVQSKKVLAVVNTNRQRIQGMLRLKILEQNERLVSKLVTARTSRANWCSRSPQTLRPHRRSPAQDLRISAQNRRLARHLSSVQSCLKRG